MKIKFIKDYKYSLDGCHVTYVSKGNEVDIKESVALRFINKGVSEIVEEKKTLPEPENKMLETPTSAEKEIKSQPTRQRRGRPKKI